MASARDAHNLLKAFSQNQQTGVENAGIAISKEILRRLIDNAYGNVSGQSASLPSNQEFDVGGTKFALLFDANVDVSNLTLDFSMQQSPGGDDLPIVTSSKIIMSVNASLAVSRDAIDKVQIGSFLIDFSQIEAVLSMEERQLVLALSSTRQSGTVERKWETDGTIDTTLRDEFGFKDEHFTEAGYLLGSIMLLLPNLLAETFLNSIDLPDIFALFPGIKFEGEARLAADGEFLLLTADTRINVNQCPIAPTDGEVTTEPTGGGGVRIPSGSPSREYPPGYSTPDRDYGDNGHLFLFTPKRLLEVNFEGIARPAVGFSDSGRKGIFRWGYRASLMLDRFGLKMTSRPLEFLIDMKLGAVGYGDCSVKIGCVTHRILGIAFRGEIDPLKILFRIHLDYRRREVVLVSMVDQAEARNFNFMTSVPWPLSEVAEYVLEKAAEKSVRDQAGKILTVTRIPIGRWGLLESVAPMVDTLALHEDSGRDSVTLGAVFNI